MSEGLSKARGGTGGPCRLLLGGETPSLLVVLPPLLLTYIGSGVEDGCRLSKSPVASEAAAALATLMADVSVMSLSCCRLRYSRTSP